MLYGVICGYGDAIMAILEKALDFKIEKGAKVGADCDYLSDEMKMDVEVDVSISIGNVFRYIFGIVGSALGGALRGLKLRLNKKYFSQKKQYKKDLAEYKVICGHRPGGLRADKDDGIAGGAAGPVPAAVHLPQSAIEQLIELLQRCHYPLLGIPGIHIHVHRIRMFGIIANSIHVLPGAQGIKSATHRVIRLRIFSIRAALCPERRRYQQ
jgi:hypothetical protein